MKGQIGGECFLYCSIGCKVACPVYGQVSYQKGYKKATYREVQPELRQLVLERDSWACQYGDCDKTVEDSELHCHHIIGVEQDPIESADVDNCITFCKEHHKLVHKLPGCSYNDLRCK